MNWTSKVKLSRSEIAEILDALADARDPYGTEAGDLELRLSNLLHRGDRQVEKERADRNARLIAMQSGTYKAGE